METFKETIILGGRHSIILGHKPTKLTVAQIQKKIEDDTSRSLEQFGLFDTATPNYSTYYPEVTAKDLKPEDDEFIEPIFRMLSNVTVNPTYNPIYFSEAVLKRSMYKMIGQTINIDHEMAVGNAIGAIKSVEWQNSYTTNGVKVPSGFNAVMKIDGKSNPRIARGIMMDPPSIHSNSVTVTFKWEKSHSDLSDDDFFQKMGTKDKDGRLIQKVCLEILSYHETSLVAHGADPFAQKVGTDGKIINPVYARDRHSLKDQEIEADILNSKKWSIDWKQLSSEEEITIPDTNKLNNNQEKQNEMEEILKFLSKITGNIETPLTKENYASTLTDYITEVGKGEPVKVLDIEGVELIENEITSLREKLADVPEDLSAKLELATLAETFMSDLRAEVKSFYTLSLAGKEPEAAIVQLIEGANLDSLKALRKQYEEISEEHFSYSCKDCGSLNVSRTSAQASGEDDDEFITRDDEDVIEKFTSPTSEGSTFLQI